jgi:hypothetical protein
MPKHLSRPVIFGATYQIIQPLGDRSSIGAA